MVRRLYSKKLLVGIEDVWLQERLMLILDAIAVVVVSVMTIGG